MMRDYRTKRPVLTVKVDGEEYIARQIQEVQKGCIQTARSRMRLYNNGSLSKDELLRALRNGSPLYVGPSGDGFSVRELCKILKCSFETAQDRLIRFEQGVLSVSEVVAEIKSEDRVGTNRGTNEWASMKSGREAREKKRMAKALHSLPDPGCLEVQYR